MASGRQVHLGVFIGTGAELDIEKLGFRPTRVELINYTDPGVLIWQNTMPEGGGFKQVDGATAILTTTGITPTGDGFTLGADADMNVDGEQVHFLAWR